MIIRFSIVILFLVASFMLIACKNKEIKITFLVDEEEYKVIEYNKDVGIILPEDPSKEGYEFIGWYKNDDFYTFDNNIESSFTLVAKWKKIVTYTVEFNFNNDDESILKKVNENDKINKPLDPTKEGYNFLGWYKGEKLFDFNSSIVENIVLEAKWEEISTEITVTYDYGDGREPLITNTDDNNRAIMLFNVERPNHIFLGWYLDGDLFDFSKVLSKSITLIAKWEEVQYFTVLFKDKDGEVLKREKVGKGHRATPPIIEDIEGYNFLGWDKDFSNITNDTEINALYDIVKFEVKFIYEDGTLIEVKELSWKDKIERVEDPVQEEDIFLGWYLDGDLFDFDKEVTSELTLVAKFEKVMGDKYVLLNDNDFEPIFGTLYKYISDYEYVIVPEKINGKVIESTSNMFQDSNVKGVALESPENIKDMSFMFLRNTSKTLELDFLDTSNVELMEGMFSNSKTNNIDLTHLELNNVRNMSRMFERSEVNSVNFEGLSLNNLETLRESFIYSNVSDVNLKNLKTPNLIDMSRMFENTENIKTIDISEIDTSNVTKMNSMFRKSHATNIILDGINTYNVLDMKYMFSETWANEINLTNFDTSNVKDMSSMFYGSRFKRLDLNNFNTGNVETMNHMFGVASARSINLTSFDTSNVSDMSYMFLSSFAESLVLTNFNTKNVVTMRETFSNARATKIDVSSFDTSNVKNMVSLFDRVNLNELNLSNFDTSNVNDMSFMFRGAKIPNLDLSSFNTERVLKMHRMFSNFKTENLNITSFNTENVREFRFMFDGFNYDHLDLSHFVSNSANNIVYMFNNANINTLDLSNFEVFNKPENNFFGDAKISLGYAKSNNEAKMFNEILNDNIFIVK